MPDQNNHHTGISVALPVYNGKEFLRNNIASVLAQDFENFELLIADDGSTDGSQELLRAIEAEGHRKLKVFYQEKNRGLFANLNFLIAASQYSLERLWSQDDLMKPGCLSEVFAFHEHHPEISMSYHSVDYIDGQGKFIADDKIDGTPAIISPERFAHICIRWGCIAGNIANVTLVKAYLNRFGSFREDLKVSGDFEMWTRLSQHANIGFLNKKLIYLRRHEGQLSRNVSSSVNSIVEDVPVYHTLINRLEGREKKNAEMYWKWRVQPMYLNEVISLLRHGERAYASRGFQYLQQEFRMSTLVLRWAFVRLLRLLRKDRWFYESLEKK